MLLGGTTEPTSGDRVINNLSSSHMEEEKVIISGMVYYDYSFYSQVSALSSYLLHDQAAGSLVHRDDGIMPPVRF